jgi:sulfopyruvate decarboxylase subunit beta
MVKLIDDQLVVTNIGGVAVEWQFLNDKDSNFYLWHSLGLATSIGFGMALSLPNKQVVVFEGDGSLLMNLGTLATIANTNIDNLKIITFNNSSYESPGGYKTATAGKASLDNIALGCGIKNSVSVDNIDDFNAETEKALNNKGVYFIDARVEIGAEDVTDPTMDAKENKYRFIRYIERTEKIQIFNPPGHVTKSRKK